MRKMFEEYIESADYKIVAFFKELQSQIEVWFDKGSLAAQGCELDGQIQISNYNPMEKFLIFNFVEPIEQGEDFENEESGSYRYRVIFMIRLDQMKGSTQAQAAPEGSQEGGETMGTPVEGKFLDINKVLLKIHQFDEENNEKGELVEEVDVTDIKEDFLIDKLSQLKDKDDNEGEDENDLKDNIYTK